MVLSVVSYNANTLLCFFALLLIGVSLVILSVVGTSFPFQHGVCIVGLCVVGDLWCCFVAWSRGMGQRNVGYTLPLYSFCYYFIYSSDIGWCTNGGSFLGCYASNVSVSSVDFSYTSDTFSGSQLPVQISLVRFVDTSVQSTTFAVTRDSRSSSTLLGEKR